MKKRSRTIKIIGAWMILSTLSGIIIYAQQGIGGNLLVSAAEWAFYCLMIMCGIGLLMTREWARVLSVRLFILYFIWSLYVSFYLSGPSFKILLDYYEIQEIVAPALLKSGIIVLLLTNILWPVIVVLFLTHPRVKRLFDPRYDPKKEEDSDI